MILHHYFKLYVVSNQKLSILFSGFVFRLHFQILILFSNSKPMMPFRTLERVISQNATKMPRSPITFLKDYVNYLAW